MQSSQPTRARQNAHPCSKCGFYDNSVWQPVEEAAVPSLQRGFSRRNLEGGQLLFKQGEASHGVYCVSSGLIALRCHHKDGSSTLMRLAYPGEIVGYRSFLSNVPHQTEARALLPSRICTVSKQTAERVAGETPGTLGRLANRCLKEIDRSHERIIAAAKLTNKERLADLLCRLMAIHGGQQGGEISMRLPLSRMDLADLIGVQPETMSRLVKRLEEDGAFSFAGREVRMPVASLQEVLELNSRS